MTFLAKAAVAALVTLLSTAAGAVTLDFDNLQPGSAINDAYAASAGVIFDNFYVVDGPGWGNPSSPAFAWVQGNRGLIEFDRPIRSLSFAYGYMSTYETVVGRSEAGGSGSTVGELLLPPSDIYLPWKRAKIVFLNPAKSVLILSANNEIGLDDMHFTAVPEPGEWTMIIAGFGMIGTAVRRRRTQARRGLFATGGRD